MTGLLAPSDARPAGGTDATRDAERTARRARGGRQGGTEDAPFEDNGPGADETRRAPRRWRARVRRAGMVASVIGALGAIASAGWWGPRVLSRLAFFRVRRVEIEGTRYASPGALIARLAIDTTTSVWTDLDVLTRRVAADPLVDVAHVERRLPGVLHVVVHERVPVALVPGPRGALLLYDATGVALPLAPARVGGVDVPLAASADPALLRALAALRSDAPGIYARVLEVARAPRAVLGTSPIAGSAGRGARATPHGDHAPVPPDHDELDFALAPPGGPGSGSSVPPAGSPTSPGTLGAPLLVRTAVDVSAARFADLAPVEADLTRRGVRPAELDLRFRDQVVARLP